MPSIKIETVKDLDLLIKSVRSAADRTVRALRDILGNERDSLQVLRMMKFKEIGHHPTDNRPLNIIEQVNQTFTYLVTLEAARWLLTQHPSSNGLRINLGTNAGLDLESLEPGMVAAEVALCGQRRGTWMALWSECHESRWHRANTQAARRSWPQTPVARS